MIALCTDFGLGGPYTGQVKAVLARLAPQVPVVDLFADLPAFSPQLAAYLLAAYALRFEPGDVIVAVVDPGVGSARRALIVEADGRWLVGPDNGLFELILRRAASWRAWPIEPSADAKIAATFHGRDLFAPAAARLALGQMPQGPEIAPTRLPAWPDDLRAVTYIDHYGNAMTGLRAAALADAILEVAGTAIRRRRIFADVQPGEALWYENANGLAEIAVSGGSAAASLGLAPGSAVLVDGGGSRKPL
jgi:S-adenosylmethionine hydrolase